METYLEDENRKEYFNASRILALETIKMLEDPNYIDSTYNRKLAEWNNNCNNGSAPRASISDPRNSIQEPATLYNGMLSLLFLSQLKE